MKTRSTKKNNRQNEKKKKYIRILIRFALSLRNKNFRDRKRSVESWLKFLDFLSQFLNQIHRFPSQIRTFGMKKKKKKETNISFHLLIFPKAFINAFFILFYFFFMFFFSKMLFKIITRFLFHSSRTNLRLTFQFRFVFFLSGAHESRSDSRREICFAVMNRIMGRKKYLNKILFVRYLSWL